MSDMIVARQEIIDNADRSASLLHFHQGQVLRISIDSIALFRDRASVDDPLGNGVIAHESIPAALQPGFAPDSGFVKDQRAGYVGLHGGAVLFIRPDGIALYDDASHALRNLNPHWLIPFVKAD